MAIRRVLQFQVVIRDGGVLSRVTMRRKDGPSARRTENKASKSRSGQNGEQLSFVPMTMARAAITKAYYNAKNSELKSALEEMTRSSS